MRSLFVAVVVDERLGHRVEVAGHDVVEDSLESRRAIGYLPETVPLYPEMRLPPDQLAELLNDRMGCVLGAKIAARLGKNVGDRVTLRSTIWSQKNGSSGRV